ncbi:hypothetical protein [Amycolatopsis anabasis]|uniref:hypothetical protein n=1 Tax=Amycolatopsis anabasis TaxID=1840409 RepID=UPI00131EBEC8|nr:hypothetical protein [Amycolatopsis anabasis]
MENKPTRAQGEQSPASFRAEEAETAKEFCGLLDELRQWVGISFMTVQGLTGKKISKSRAHQLVHADQLPSPDDLVLFLEACNVTTEEADRWRRGASRIKNGAPRDTVFEKPRPAPRPRSPMPPPEAGLPPGEPAFQPLHSGVGAAPWGTTAPAPTPAPPPIDYSQAAMSFPPAVKGPMTVSVRALLILTAVVLLLTGATAGLWLLRVPTELILAVIAGVVVCVSSWLMALRWRWQAGLDREHRRPSFLVEPDPDAVFGDSDLQATPPTIGL